MKYDVIIAGGGTAGCACAYTAAKAGLSVLLAEKNSFLGGTMTSSLVTPAMNTSFNNINTDFYKILMCRLHDIGGEITYADGNIGWFNPELMKIILDTLMLEAGVDVLFNCEVNSVQPVDNLVTSISLKGLIDYRNTVSIFTDKHHEMAPVTIDTKYLVDATGDAEIFKKLNCKFLKNKNAFQPVSLRFIMSGIDISTFSDWIIKLDKNRNVTTSYIIEGEIHLSTAYTWDINKNWALESVFEKGIIDGDIKEEDINYFQLFTIPGMPASLAFNCPRILSETNTECLYDVTNALIAGRMSIFRLSEFLKRNFKGFENAYVSSIANTLGIRVSNCIKGKYVYSIEDLKSGKKFEHPCLISNYPVDIHSIQKDCSVLEYNQREYMLPLESLMSCDFDNLYAIGRCISADFEAQSALRIIPSCFSMGEGLAKYLVELENKKS